MKLFNKYEKKIIELLITGGKTLPEIANNLQISKPGTSKYLKKLEEQNLVKSSYERNTEGRTIRYTLQPFHLVFSSNPENESIVFFKANEKLNTDYLFLGYIPQKNFRREVKTYLEETSKLDLGRFMIILYGSVAKGSAHRKSDIDLLFLKKFWSKNDKNQVMKQLAKASEHCKHQVKPLFKTIADFETTDEHLKKEIKNHGVILYSEGDPWHQIKKKMKRYKIITT